MRETSSSPPTHIAMPSRWIGESRSRKNTTPTGISRTASVAPEVTAARLTFQPARYASRNPISTPTLATPGTLISVYGSGFNYATFAMIDGNYGYTIQPSAITVYQGGTQLTFILPSGLSYGNHSLQVAEKAGSAMSNTINFTSWFSINI